MMRYQVSAITLAISLLPALADDAIDKKYLMSLFNEPGKAQEEFARVALQNPLLTAYALALFSKDTCGVPEPSSALKQASGGDGALSKGDGKTIFIVAGVVATMSYPTKEAQTRACESARDLIAEAERVAGTR